MKYDGRLAGDARQTNKCTGPERHACRREARYCPMCGCATLFFRKGLLRDWQESLKKAEKPEYRLSVSEFEQL